MELGLKFVLCGVHKSATENLSTFVNRYTLAVGLLNSRAVSQSCFIRWREAVKHYENLNEYNNIPFFDILFCHV